MKIKPIEIIGNWDKGYVLAMTKTRGGIVMKVFIAGPRAISALDKAVNEKLHSIYVNNHTVLVGDANGVDKAVQNYFAKGALSQYPLYPIQSQKI